MLYYCIKEHIMSNLDESLAEVQVQYAYGFLIY